MKATVHREAFLSACQLASTAAAARDVKPILKNLKAIMAEDRCTLMATDLDLGLRLEVRSIKVEEPGEAILPCARLIAILRESVDEEMHIDASVERCHLHGAHNEFEMPGDDPAHFPDVPTFTEDKYFEVEAGPLGEMIRRTVFAASADNPRYAMNGVLWELEANMVRLVATDGRRLAVTTAPATRHGAEETRTQTHVVPPKAMNLLERLLVDPKEAVKVSLRPNEALFRTERAVICSRLTEGRYPPYREVFPKKATTRIPLNLEAFHHGIRQSAIMTDEENKKINMVFSKGLLTMQARGSESGRSKVEVPLEFDGKELKISFGAKFLTDMLRVLDPSAPLVLDIVNGDTAAVLRSGDNYSYVVMPLTT